MALAARPPRANIRPNVSKSEGLMARIEGIEEGEADGYAAAVLKAQAKGWGAPLLNHLVYARRPSIFRGARAMWQGVEASGLIEPRLQALLNLRVAPLNGCEV